MMEELAGMLRKYQTKVKEERRARLEGRIVDADFAVRQLTWLEVILDLGGEAAELIESWRQGGLHPVQIAATPMSVLIDAVRREAWQRMGEPERPPPGPLGRHDGRVATGPDISFRPARDGEYRAWHRRQIQNERYAAEAQKAWEEKAEAESREWRERLEARGESSPGFPGEGDHAKHGGEASSDVGRGTEARR